MNETNAQTSPTQKSTFIAGILGIFFGATGAHFFYLGGKKNIRKGKQHLLALAICIIVYTILNIAFEILLQNDININILFTIAGCFAAFIQICIGGILANVIIGLTEGIKLLVQGDQHKSTSPSTDTTESQSDPSSQVASPSVHSTTVNNNHAVSQPTSHAHPDRYRSLKTGLFVISIQMLVIGSFIVQNINATLESRSYLQAGYLLVIAPACAILCAIISVTSIKHHRNFRWLHILALIPPAILAAFYLLLLTQFLLHLTGTN